MDGNSKRTTICSARATSNPLLDDARVTIVFFSSLFLLVISVFLSLFAPQSAVWSSATVILAAMGSSVFFPLTVGYFYDRFKEKREGESIWRVFKELSDGGILRIYKDREEGQNQDNALVDLRRAFDEHREGTVRLVGVSLRVFFSQSGPFYRSIANICDLHKRVNNKVGLRALVCDPESAEVLNRAQIETPDRLHDPLIRIDIDLSVASMENLATKYGPGALQYGCYSSAPYCTLVMFPDKCYFSPNLLSTDPPVRLPMVVFSAKSHGYKKLEEYFEYLWQNKKAVGANREERT